MTDVSLIARGPRRPNSPPVAVGAQKLVPTLAEAHERIYRHSLILEDARAIATYGQNSSVGKILEIHQELPGRIHVVLIQRAVDF